jgi:hypothetical protein
MALTARHGLPPSVILVVALPYACFGQTMTDKDLPGFAQGASEGLRKSFDLADPIYSAYTLGAHSMWIERAKGTVIGHAEVQYTVEMVCSTLKKGAICWMALAKDDEALKIFEHSAVILDGEAQPALVPETAFAHKP